MIKKIIFGFIFACLSITTINAFAPYYSTEDSDDDRTSHKKNEKHWLKKMDRMHLQDYSAMQLRAKDDLKNPDIKESVTVMHVIFKDPNTIKLINDYAYSIRYGTVKEVNEDSKEGLDLLSRTKRRLFWPYNKLALDNIPGVKTFFEETKVQIDMASQTASYCVRPDYGCYLFQNGFFIRVHNNKLYVHDLREHLSKEFYTENPSSNNIKFPSKSKIHLHDFGFQDKKYNEKYPTIVLDIDYQEMSRVNLFTLSSEGLLAATPVFHASVKSNIWIWDLTKDHEDKLITKLKSNIWWHVVSLDFLSGGILLTSDRYSLTFWDIKPGKKNPPKNIIASDNFCSLPLRKIRVLQDGRVALIYEPSFVIIDPKNPKKFDKKSSTYKHRGVFDIDLLPNGNIVSIAESFITVAVWKPNAPGKRTNKVASLYGFHPSAMYTKVASLYGFHPSAMYTAQDEIIQLQNDSSKRYGYGTLQVSKQVPNHFELVCQAYRESINDELVDKALNKKASDFYNKRLKINMQKKIFNAFKDKATQIKKIKNEAEKEFIGEFREIQCKRNALNIWRNRTEEKQLKKFNEYRAQKKAIAKWRTYKEYCASAFIGAAAGLGIYKLGTWLTNQ